MGARQDWRPGSSPPAGNPAEKPLTLFPAFEKVVDGRRVEAQVLGGGDVVEFQAYVLYDC